MEGGGEIFPAPHYPPTPHVVEPLGGDCPPQSWEGGTISEEKKPAAGADFFAPPTLLLSAPHFEGHKIQCVSTFMGSGGHKL